MDNGAALMQGYNFVRFAQPLAPRFLKHGRERITVLHGLWLMQSTRDSGHTLLLDFTNENGAHDTAPLHKIHVRYQHQEKELSDLADLCREVYEHNPPHAGPNNKQAPSKNNTAQTLGERLHALCRGSKGKAAPCGLAGCEHSSRSGCARRNAAANDDDELS